MASAVGEFLLGKSCKLFFAVMNKRRLFFNKGRLFSNKAGLFSNKGRLSINHAPELNSSAIRFICWH